MFCYDAGHGLADAPGTVSARREIGVVVRWVFLLVLVTGLCAVVVGVALALLPPGGTFTDDDGNIHEASIEAIAADGITKGCNPPTNDLYFPSSSVTRGQMIAITIVEGGVAT